MVPFTFVSVCLSVSGTVTEGRPTAFGRRSGWCRQLVQQEERLVLGACWERGAGSGRG